MSADLVPFMAAVPDPNTTLEPAQVIALLESARLYLQYVEDPREAMHIVKQADAIRYLAQKADASGELQNQAAEVALRARRKMGEILAAVPREPIKHPSKVRTRTNSEDGVVFAYCGWADMDDTNLGDRICKVGVAITGTRAA